MPVKSHIRSAAALLPSLNVYTISCLMLVAALSLASDAFAERRIGLKVVSHVNSGALDLKIKLPKTGDRKLASKKRKRVRRVVELQSTRNPRVEGFTTEALFETTRRRIRHQIYSETPGIIFFQARDTENFLLPSSVEAGLVQTVIDSTEKPGPVAYNPELLPGQTQCSSEFRLAVLREANERRRMFGVSDLTIDSKLETAALAHSIWMADHRELSHLGWLEEILATGGEYSKVGQNAWTYMQNETHIIDGFQASPGHARNLFSPDYTHVGINCVYDAYTGKIWGTMNFGRP